MITAPILAIKLIGIYYPVENRQHSTILEISIIQIDVEIDCKLINYTANIFYGIMKTCSFFSEDVFIQLYFDILYSVSEFDHLESEFLPQVFDNPPIGAALDEDIIPE